MKTNDMVKFANPMPDEDASGVYRVVEVNGDRCIIEVQVEMAIKPTQVVMVADLVEVK